MVSIRPSWAVLSRVRDLPITTFTGPDMAGAANSFFARLISATGSFGWVTVTDPLTSGRRGQASATVFAVAGTSSFRPGLDNTVRTRPSTKLMEPSRLGVSTFSAALRRALCNRSSSTETRRGCGSPPVNRCQISLGT